MVEEAKGKEAGKKPAAKAKKKKPVAKKAKAAEKAGTVKTAGRPVQEKKAAPQEAEKNWLDQNKLLVALVAVVAITAWLAFTSLPTGLPEASVGEFHKASGTIFTVDTAERIKFFLIYSAECEGCEIDGSFVKLLNKNEIKFSAKKIEASTEEGQEFVRQLGLRKLPVAVIDATSITDSMNVKSDENLRFSTESINLKILLDAFVIKFPNDTSYDADSQAYVLTELSLDGAKHVDFIAADECLPEEEGMLARVDLFVDPYGAPFIKAKDTLDFYRSIYKDRMEFNFRYLPVDASKTFPLDTPRGNIETIARYFACAEKEGKLEQAENAFYARYCAFNDDDLLDASERQNCEDSNHFGFLISGDEAQEIADKELGLDKQAFGKCLEELPEQFNNDTFLADYLRTYRAPTVVVNCNYAGHVSNIDQVLCKFNPELEHCAYFGGA